MAISLGTKPGGRKRPMSEINITPFTDVCLVLLIIFMVSASFMGAQRGLDIKLPSPSTDTKTDTRPVGDITLSIDKDGGVKMTVTQAGGKQVYSQAVSSDKLVNTLSTAATQYKIQTVTIKAERAVVYRNVILVMDSVKEAGIEYMALAVQQPAVAAPGTSKGASAPAGAAGSTAGA